MKNISLLFVTFFFAQCTSINDDIGYTFDVKEQLFLERIEYPELLGNPMQIFCVDSVLLINDFYGDSLVHVYNLKTQKVERKLIRKGIGPNELLPPLELQLSGDKLWIYSRPLHSMTQMLLSEFNDGGTLVKKGVLDGKADCFVPISGENLIFSGLWDKRYAFFNVSEGSLIEFGEYPDLWYQEEDFSSIVKAMFHQSRFAVNTKREKFASCSYFVLELFDYNSKTSNIPELKLRKQLGAYEYDYIDTDVVETRMRENCGLASVDVVAGEEYLYVLTQDAANKKNRNIMVLDWDGNPVKLLTFGKRIICFSMDEERGMGYCIVEDPEYDLYSFKFIN